MWANGDEAANARQAAGRTRGAFGLLHRFMRLAILGLLLAAIEVLAGKERCGPNKPSCPSDKPCCSADGYCGGGAEQCTSGCQPQYSQYPFSCIPNSVCEDMDLAIKPDMYNQDNYFRPLLRYNGDASQTPFVFEQGYLG